MEDKRRFTFAIGLDENLRPDLMTNQDFNNERDETPDDDVEGEDDEYVPNESFD
jgi:hypothetical protein